ncbi:MAG: hypothetical protein ACYCQI_06200 [Gammaproteobacteria bacterium]
MKDNEENDKFQSDDEGESGQGSGGKTGEIRFIYRDAMSLPPRDDMLPPSEIKRLLIIHKDLHRERVEKQKMTRKEREALKEGKLHLQASYMQGLGQGGGTRSNYKKHPIANKAQFSGIDKQTSNLPTEFNAETNLEMQNKLENRYVLRNAPKFNPKPRPPGG